MDIKALKELVELELDIQAPSRIQSDHDYHNSQLTIEDLKTFLEEFRLNADNNLSPGMFRRAVEGLQSLITQWDAHLREYELTQEDDGHRNTDLTAVDSTKIQMGRHKEPKDADNFPFITSSEYNAVERAAAEGNSGRNWVVGEEAIMHSVRGASHQVRLMLTEEDQQAGLTLEFLQTLAKEQDSDGIFALLYVTRLLAPPLGRGQIEPQSVIVDLDDVMEKIGLTARSSSDRLEKRRRINQYLLFGSRAEVHGQRTRIYRSKVTGEVIDTVLQTALWYMLDKEVPARKALFPNGKEVPVRVEMILSREWAKLLSSPETAQFLPMGELLGSIPPGKPSGAWARIIGLSLANFWRRKRPEILNGNLKPTRRELLENYPPTTGPVSEIFASGNPRRAIDYWCGAMSILLEQKFIERSDEALLSPSAVKSQLDRQGWVDKWLDEQVEIKPSGQLREILMGFSLPVKSKPTRHPRPLKKRS